MNDTWWRCLARQTTATAAAIRRPSWSWTTAWSTPFCSLIRRRDVANRMSPVGPPTTFSRTALMYNRYGSSPRLFFASHLHVVHSYFFSSFSVIRLLFYREFADDSYVPYIGDSSHKARGIHLGTESHHFFGCSVELCFLLSHWYLFLISAVRGGCCGSLYCVILFGDWMKK